MQAALTRVIKDPGHLKNKNKTKHTPQGEHAPLHIQRKPSLYGPLALPEWKVGKVGRVYLRGCGNKDMVLFSCDWWAGAGWTWLLRGIRFISWSNDPPDVLSVRHANSRAITWKEAMVEMNPLEFSLQEDGVLACHDMGRSLRVVEHVALGVLTHTHCHDCARLTRKAPSSPAASTQMYIIFIVITINRSLLFSTQIICRRK